MTYQIEKMMGLALAAFGSQIAFGAPEEMRPLSADRPDATESPYTVDKGRFQLELEVASATFDGSGEAYGFLETNIKYGVGTDTDLQLVVPVYGHEAGGSEGIGDMQLRVKHNFLGNDGGDFAIGIMPFVQVPSGNGGVSSGEVEGGIILPMAFEGSCGWGYGFQVEADLVADEAGNGHYFSFLVSAVAAHDLTEETAFFAELVGIAGEGPEGTNEGYFNTGITWSPEPNLQFDTGVRVGLTNESEDLTPFFGVSVKF